jgi:glycosyltransferase involved in cell wall biosynthesis
VYERPTDEEVAQVLSKYRLPGCLAVYPAQTWPHKNHKLLLEALQLLRDRDNVVIPLVCTGAKTEHYAQLAQLVEQRELHTQVQFIGWISERELMALYRAAEMMIVPTLFEGFGFPVFEAFAEGIPVACSAVTSLPEQTGGAALLFEPNDVEELASAILRLHNDETLRRVLIERGRKRLTGFSWRKTAEEYRALYRRAAGQLDQACNIPETASR